MILQVAEFLKWKQTVLLGSVEINMQQKESN